MRVEIGPYGKWFGPYQFADLFKYVGCSEDTCDKIGEWLPTWPFQFIENLKPKRKIVIRIDKYDTWSADHTLAMIIAPVLKAVKENKNGLPGDFLSAEYNTLVSSKEYWEETTGGPLHQQADKMFDEGAAKWDATLDHMIWSFEEYIKDDWDEQYWTGEFGEWKTEETGKTFPNPITGKEEPTYRATDFGGTRTCDWEGRQRHWEKMRAGIKLFAEYYPNLWD